ncbi:MAG: hypothetical protein WA005_18055 [Candidatus Binataceae bacterium]
MTKPLLGVHGVRYGTPADQKFLLGQYLSSYEYLALNATIIGHAPAAIASLIAQRLKGKPFFVDPQTHAFQHNTSYLESQGETTAGEIKRSIRTLLKAYGDPAEDRVLNQRRPVSSKDFANDSTRRGFCERVLNFQMNVVQNQLEYSDAAKYYEYLTIKGKLAAFANSLRPRVVVAPYFYLAPNLLPEWLNHNVEFARLAREYADSHDVGLAVQIVLAREFLSSSIMRDKVVRAYRQTTPELFLVWVSAFSEFTAGEEELAAFVSLLRELGETAEVVNLYGSYFSFALKQSGTVKRLAGVVHGLEYGEDRDVLPVGGGLPIAKFYVPVLHSRLKFRDAVRAVRELGGFRDRDSYFKAVCACAQCKTLIKGNPERDFAAYGESQPVSFTRKAQPIVTEYPTREAKERCVSHFMWCKKTEFGSRATKNVILDELKAAARLERVVGPEAAHCTTWRSVLSSGQ